jgi:hypothetical protein
MALQPFNENLDLLSSRVTYVDAQNTCQISNVISVPNHWKLIGKQTRKITFMKAQATSFTICCFNVMDWILSTKSWNASIIRRLPVAVRVGNRPTMTIAQTDISSESFVKLWFSDSACRKADAQWWFVHSNFRAWIGGNRFRGGHAMFYLKSVNEFIIVKYCLY